MKKLTALISATILSATFGATAFAASPDAYIVNFRNDDNADSQRLDRALASAMSIARVNIEEVVIDTSTAAKWEKGAHDAFDRNIVPVFNKWVGLPGFAAIVDAKSKQILGCVNASFSASEIAAEVQKMAARSNGKAYLSNASTTTKTTQCPATYNVDPGQ